jgi:hypothetical protein
MMHLNTPDRGYYFKADAIKKIQDHYGAKYMGYWAVKRKNGWSDEPVDVFYQPTPDTAKGHSHYFGMFVDPAGTLMITDAQSAFSEPIYGLLCDDGEVIVSRYRHDYVTKDGCMVDGGRDYFKRSDQGKTVKIIVDRDQFVITEEL